MNTPHPRLALLSNGRYGVMITAAGSGCSTWRGLDVTRWREDATRDCWGQFCYVRDLSDGTVWSAGYQPLCRAADEYEVAFHADRAEFRRRDGDIETRWAVCVAPDHDAEVRVVTLVNHGGRPRELDLTSYAEVCLNHRRADQAHPAFAKLFLETEFVPESGAPAVPPPAAGRGPEAGLGRPRHGGGRPGGRRGGVRDRPGPVPGPRPHARPTPPPSTPGRACPGRPARCWTRSSACGGASASTRGPRPASRSSPERPTPGRRRPRWPSSSGTSRPPTGRSPAPGPLPGRAAGAGPDAGRRRPVQPPGRGRRLHRPGAAPAGRRRRQPPGAAGPVAARHLRRPADRAGPRRRGRRRVAGPPARAVARLRPPPRPGPGPRHPGRAPRRRRRRGSKPTSRPALPARCSASRAGCSSWPRARSRPTTRCCSRPPPGPSSAAAAAPWPSSSTADRPRPPSRRR